MKTLQWFYEAELNAQLDEIAEEIERLEQRIEACTDPVIREKLNDAFDVALREFSHVDLLWEQCRELSAKRAC